MSGDLEALLSPRRTSGCSRGASVSPRAGASSPGGSPSSSDAPIDLLATTLLFLFPALGGALFGYDIGSSSGALVSLTSAQTAGTDWYALSSVQSGLVVSSSLFGALGGSVLALVFGDRLGRKTELLSAGALYGTAAVVCASAASYPQLIVGRVLYGVGIGFAMHAAPAYISETAPSRVRGLLISLKECAIVLGILLGYFAGYSFVGDVGGWRMIYGASGAGAALLVLGMSLIPESARWMLFAGRPREEARAALARSRGASARAEDVEREVEEMAALAGAGRQGAGVDFGPLFEPRYRAALWAGMSLMLFQQITGQPSVLYYAAQILQAVGFGTAEESTGLSVVLGLFKLIMTAVAVLYVDKAGRRPLLLGGVAALCASLFALAAAQGGLLGASGPVVALVAFLLYVGAYQISFGPISWLIVGEVFPLAVRGQAIALATLINFGSNFLVSLVLPSMQEVLGQSLTYAAFGSVAVLAVASIYLSVPETKGKSLEEIEEMMIGDKSS
ncbi:unnamed protein product [Pedinophyceae sp. YPF-701]|nr:unnamed protein product [Pedinophyceae sp. YPF-701]